MTPGSAPGRRDDTARGPLRTGPRQVGVVVMAKVPRAGHTKTRLGPALSPAEAASFYTAMLTDRCAQVAGLDGVAPAIALVGGGADELPGIVPAGFRRVPQPEGDLGACLDAAARAFLAEGTPVVLVDSDSPTLPTAYLETAVARLREGGCDVVLGPSQDGGYYLIGLGCMAPELFRDMPWSTGGVAAETLARARARDLSLEVLPAWWDVDRPEDVARLRRSLFDASWPERTAAWLRTHRPPAAPGAPTPGTRDAASPGPPGTASRATPGVASPGPPGVASRATPGVASRESPGAPDAVEDWREPWQTLGTRLVYATAWLKVFEDRALMPGGRPTTYSVVRCGACVGVLPFVDRDRILLVRQYRYVAGRTTWEMPTGGVHAGETVEEAAARELAEEAQVRARRLVPLGRYHTSKSVMDETAHLFVAEGLEPTSATADETELLRGEPVPFARALGMVLDGEIVDSMTIIAILRVALERTQAPVAERTTAT